MKKQELLDSECSLARAASLLGDSWSLLVLREVFLGNHRFETIQAQTGASSTTVANRLARLVDEGLLRRRPYQQNPLREEFHLSRKGADTWPVLVALMQWGDDWLREDSRKPLKLRHQACGHQARLVTHCEACGETMTPADATPKLGTVLRRERRQRQAHFEETIKRSGEASR
jgi:DNA-binding HxlR family transcriptional regulator